MTDESAFAAALDADPDNFDCRLVFADWLEEQGDARAAGMRWLGENRKRPLQTTTGSGPGRWWRWISKEHYDAYSSPERAPEYSRIPNRLLSLLADEDKTYPVEVIKSFLARHAAESAFCLAFATVAAAEDELRRVRKERALLNHPKGHSSSRCAFAKVDANCPRCASGLKELALHGREDELLAICGDTATK